MTEELKIITNHLSKHYKQAISCCEQDKECKEYDGFNLGIGSLQFKYRKAKSTPKKVGLFVTLWKRNEEKQTVPFDINDVFDFYIIATKEGDNFGFFLFPKSVLLDKQILSTKEKEGKRGFRVYPTWAEVANKQAIKTKSWQINYFTTLVVE